MSRSFAILALPLLLAALAAAQAPSGAAIVLPHKLLVGQPATLAVLDAEGRLVPGAQVEFSGNARVTTDATGRATFTAPDEAGVLVARLPGTAVRASALVGPAPADPAGGVQFAEVPRLISLHDRFTVTGSGFRGEADANNVTLGNRPAIVLAASPLALVVMPGPGTPPGPAQLEVEAGRGSPGPLPVTLVALELAAAKEQLKPKEKGELHVRVRGTEQRLEIEARNLTPNIVKLPKGNLQRLATSGGADNKAAVEMEGRRVGNFSVSVRLVPGVAGLPDTEAARQRLLAALQIAPASWTPRIDRLIRRLEKDPQNVPRVRNELEKMLAELPAGEFGRLLESAWRILLSR